MVIDFHTHIFEDRSAPRIMRDMEERARVHSCADGTHGGLLAQMDRSGVDLSVTSRITIRPEQVRPVNAWLEALRSARVHPLATMHPDFPDACAEVARLRARGFRGFKLHPDYQGFFADEERMFPFYEAVRDAGMFLLCHAGLDRGLPDSDLHATPRRLARVLDAVPGLKLIAAHMGGEDIYDETERHLWGRDVYLDTAFILRLMPPETFAAHVRGHSARRVLFGTDSPWNDPGRDLAYLRALPCLSADDLDRVTRRNAAGLLGLAG